MACLVSCVLPPGANFEFSAEALLKFVKSWEPGAREVAKKANGRCSLLLQSSVLQGWAELFLLTQVWGRGVGVERRRTKTKKGEAERSHPLGWHETCGWIWVSDSSPPSGKKWADGGSSWPPHKRTKYKLSS